jgi:hypothetical protein
MDSLDMLSLAPALFLFAVAHGLDEPGFGLFRCPVQGGVEDCLGVGEQGDGVAAGSHLFTVRASTPRCAAKARMLRRSALVSAPVQRWTVAMRVLVILSIVGDCIERSTLRVYYRGPTSTFSDKRHPGHTLGHIFTPPRPWLERTHAVHVPPDRGIGDCHALNPTSEV